MLAHGWTTLLLPHEPQIGARMLAANRSYRVRVSYLPAESEQLEAAGKVRAAGHNMQCNQQQAAGLVAMPALLSFPA